MKRVLALCLAACGAAAPPGPTPAQREADSAPAVTALQAARFDEASRIAHEVLARDPRNARAAAVRAIAMYQRTGEALVDELGAIFDRAERRKLFDHQRGREAWTGFLAALSAVDRDLDVVAASRDFSLELCLACWEHDWNRSGDITESDRKMFELEYDGKGGELDEKDPRRRPTYRFDAGDAEWGRAMVAFQRAFVELVLAYRWTELDDLFDSAERIQLPLIDAGRVNRAGALILAGLERSDRARAAYLAETDDDREWVPSPRQKRYAMPLEVDDAIYATWAAVVRDVRKLLSSEEGISIREVATMIDERAAVVAPDAFVDVGRMLREPKTIAIDVSQTPSSPEITERILRGVLGNGYAAKMRASPLVGRLRHMVDDVAGGRDLTGRKLRYLLWLN